jgi:2-amino-4-hydroxy-6-hydroxymethyldihydropteridine diphosphokinase
MNTYYLILGSNIDKEINLPRAVQLLTQFCDVQAVSQVYETAPVGTLEQEAFFNAAACVRSSLEPLAFKQQIGAAIEHALLRRRSADRNAPRTIDIDIVLCNDRVLDYDGRHIPDPDLRRFPHVALPIAELAPEMAHPETGEALQALANRLRQSPIPGYNGPQPIHVRADIALSTA